jgi:polysaccharide pyruvyl transferase CsaB
MKVLHLIGGGDVGGAKVHVLSLVKELSKHIDVKIVSLRSGMFADDARSMGLDVEVVRSGNFAADIKKVVKIIDKGGYQIIHSHGSKANMFSIISKRFTKLPTVTTVHSDYKLDYMHNTLKRLSFGSINTIALRYIDYYIGVSDNFKNMLISRKFNPEKIFVVYNGIDFSKPTKGYNRSSFSDKYNLQLNKSDVVVGILARLYPVKNIGTLLKAAKVALKHNPKLKFVIGGDGEDRKHLEEMASALGISDKVFFLGWIYDPDELMSVLDINVLTSISESFPYSILEGAKFKKATISSNVGGIPDLISHGINGYLFNPGDYLRLADYIVELSFNHKKRNEMGEKLYNIARVKFSISNMCKTQLDIYSSILQKENVKTIPKSSYDVIISGYYGFKNIGDDAMLMGIIDSLKKYKSDVRAIVLSKDPVETKKLYGVDSIKRTSLDSVFKAMKNAKLFIYGGGNIIQDNTSTRSLFYYLGSIWLAKLMGLKVMFYANGIGPLNKKINMKLTKQIMNRVDTITLREKLSLEELICLGVDKPRIVLTADPALTVEMEPSIHTDKIFSEEGIELSGPYVGFSLRQWQGREKYEEVIAKTADYMIDKYGIKPVFIPMHNPGDLIVIESVVSKMKGKGYVIRKKYDVSQTMGIISKMEFLIGMRLHALIFAASLGIPIIGLVYEPKIEGFLQYVNQPSAGYVQHLEFDKLKELVDEFWHKRFEIAEQLKKDIIILKQKAFDSARIAVDLITGAK